MSKVITLTESQAMAVIQLLDLATKAGGLNTAATALPIATEIDNQLKAVPQQTNP